MKLIMPVICECGFNTMDAQEAYDHAMKHEREEREEEERQVTPGLCVVNGEEAMRRFPVEDY